MQLDWLRTFVTLVDLQHFTKTSEHLHLSQPTVSVHIKKLEETLGVPLINRSKQRPFEVTEQGKIVYEHGITILENWLKLQSAVTMTEMTKLRIGATHTVSDVLLPEFITQFRTLFPKAKLQLMIQNHDTIIKALTDHSIDIGFVEGTKGIEPFHTQVISQDELKFYANRAVSLEQTPLILRESGSGTRAYADRFLQTQRITPVEVIEVSSHFLIKQLAVRGLGAALLSSAMVKEEVARGELIAIEPYTIHRPFYAVYGEHILSEPLFQTIISTLPLI